jgi:hypothetical protein
MIALGNGRKGDLLVVSRVPWISYNWGPYSMGLNVLLAPGQEEDGWRYTPEGIRACVDFAGREPTLGSVRRVGLQTGGDARQSGARQRRQGRGFPLRKRPGNPARTQNPRR